MARNIVKEGNITEDKAAYILAVYSMFIGSDLAGGAALDVESHLRKAGRFTHERKQDIEKIKFHTNKVIEDIDNQCSIDFACKFGDLADEIKEMVLKHLTKKLIKKDKPTPKPRKKKEILKEV